MTYYKYNHNNKAIYVMAKTKRDAVKEIAYQITDTVDEKSVIKLPKNVYPPFRRQ